jgi:hypothetical protein
MMTTERTDGTVEQLQEERDNALTIAYMQGVADEKENARVDIARLDAENKMLLGINAELEKESESALLYLRIIAKKNAVMRAMAETLHKFDVSINAEFAKTTDEIIDHFTKQEEKDNG